MRHFRTAVIVPAFFCLLTVVQSQQPEGQSPASDPPQSQKEPIRRVGEAEARREAELLHTSVDSALRIVHDRYFREDEGLPIPAAILKELFRDLEDQQGVKLRWLAVEGQAMNSDHKPQSEFDHLAVKALKDDRPFLEQSEAGIYRRATPIRLSNHCLKCHVPNRRSLEDRTAGLIIEIPLLQP